MKPRTFLKYFLAVYWCVFLTPNIEATSLVPIVSKLKKSVVGVGLYDAMGAQTHQLRGTGFVIGDGSLVATNYHVVAAELDPKVVQYYIVFSGNGRNPQIHRIKIVAVDPVHDLALLQLDTKLTPVVLAKDEYADDGTEILLTGFPIGAVLGLYPATHRGIVAATTPDVIPSINSNQLSTNILKRLDSKFMIYQLDITAYPGNSGSPVYNADSGEVLGILNKVFVKESKETLLEKPSGISYAIPIVYLRELALAQGFQL